MARPMRVQFAGAVYHVASRGNRREAIFLDDVDRLTLVDLLAAVAERFGWIVHAFCLMDNHYHLLAETTDANLARGMMQLNGMYTRRFNHRHGTVGHIFQGRYYAGLIQKEEHLVETHRYIVLNPVRAAMVSHPRDHRWNSYRIMVGEAATTGWHDTDWILGRFADEREPAVRAYQDFLAAGIATSAPPIDDAGRNVAGDEDFRARVARIAARRHGKTLREVPRAQRYVARPPLAELFRPSPRNKADRNQRIAVAYLQHGYTMGEIARHLGIHHSTVSLAVARASGAATARGGEIRKFKT